MNKNNNEPKYTVSYSLKGKDFLEGGKASSKIKSRLKDLGISPEIIRRVAIIAFEAEMNVIIHAYHGTIKAEIDPEKIAIETVDKGPGIEDVEKAMEEGYTTAGPEVLEMGFGAGMGLPNIKRYSDEVDVTSQVNEGTRLYATVYFN
ncbi:ATP-binding protein [Natranaerofaba carboxydovora]|uniref:ATP-binding protein n=1 Tax=Natranaerofaba carboxydovora TaxID=2742683 RepID=UPI001F136F75|nr:anti-sigma regulatory factor [Natranaerofaba carboxydovora]UMZ75294.1 Serine/threonine-protein kinase RsbT [Natranaerofaba carboxydovora]